MRHYSHLTRLRVNIYNFRAYLTDPPLDQEVYNGWIPVRKDGSAIYYEFYAALN